MIMEFLKLAIIKIFKVYYQTRRAEKNKSGGTKKQLLNIKNNLIFF